MAAQNEWKREGEAENARGKIYLKMLNSALVVSVKCLLHLLESCVSLH